MRKLYAIFILISGIVAAQRTVETENGQPFLKQDARYTSTLEQSNFNSNLELDIYKSRFDFLNANTPLNIDYNEITYAYVKKLLSYRWYPQVIGLSVYYFPLFESKLDKYGVPRELKYLAIVESSLNPRTVSWAGARGLWQFMPGTGAQYGLTRNQYVDTFFDPVANADAAARYLRDLYRELGDWSLAISAYNCGPGNVRKAIRRAGSRNYWRIRPFLPKETQAYLPSFIAVNYVFNFYKQHGMRPKYFRYNFFDLAIIRVNKDTTLTELGLRYNYAVLKFANPQFLTNTVPAGSIVYVGN